jgi:signal transduction histidine kinase
MMTLPFLWQVADAAQATAAVDPQRIMLINVALILALVIFFTVVILSLVRHSTRQRVEAARLAAMGTATGRILHQVKNPLQTILLHAEMLEDDSLISDIAIRRELCQAIVGEAARMADLLGHLSTFASGIGRQLAADPIGLSEVVESAVKRISDECEAARIRLEIGPLEEIAIAGDGVFLPQALGNLLRNSYEALRESVTSGDARIEISLRRRGAGAIVEVRDNAAGIEPELVDELFEPFVTRKGSGLGLGLPMAREIVEGHGGRLELRSRPGSGTTVTLVLPIRAVESPAGYSA